MGGKKNVNFKERKKMTQRVHFRRKHSFATKSNKTKLIKTPGKKVNLHKSIKKTSPPSCHLSRRPLSGLHAYRPVKRAKKPNKERTVNRAYGGVLSHQVLKTRIIRAFLIEDKDYLI